MLHCNFMIDLRFGMADGYTHDDKRIWIESNAYASLNVCCLFGPNSEDGICIRFLLWLKVDIDIDHMDLCQCFACQFFFVVVVCSPSCYCFFISALIFGFNTKPTCNYIPLNIIICAKCCSNDWFWCLSMTCRLILSQSNHVNAALIRRFWSHVRVYVPCKCSALDRIWNTQRIHNKRKLRSKVIDFLRLQLIVLPRRRVWVCNSTGCLSIARSIHFSSFSSSSSSSTSVVVYMCFSFVVFFFFFFLFLWANLSESAWDVWNRIPLIITLYMIWKLNNWIENNGRVYERIDHMLGNIGNALQ